MGRDKEWWERGLGVKNFNGPQEMIIPNGPRSSSHYWPQMGPFLHR